MILPAVQLEVSTILSFGDTPLFARIAVSIMGGTVWERWNILHNDPGWPRDLPQQL